MESLGNLLPFAVNAAYLCIALLSFVATYRLLLHPLSRYPGPLLAKLSDVYGGYQAARRQTHLSIYQSHQKYGPVVRIGPNRLVFNSVTAFQDIYQNPSITKSRLYDISRLGKPAHVFNTIDRDLHRQKRQPYSVSLAERSMRTFEPAMSEHIDTFLKLILRDCRNNTPLEMTSRCQYLTFDIVSHLALGQRLNLQTEEGNRILLRLLIMAKARINLYMHLPPLAVLEPLLNYIPSEQARDFQQRWVKIFTARQTQAETDTDTHDLYSILTEPSVKDLFAGSLQGEIIFFITAGGTPPATVICALFFYLTRNPHCHKTLVDEVRATFPNGSDIRSGTLLQSCKYLRACIDESMRIAPPSLATLWREQAEESPGPVVIDGQVIPKGTHVGVNIYSLHHNEEYFPDPFSFKPERWLSPGREQKGSSNLGDASKASQAFVPFIIGSRACTGKSMLYLEVSTIIAKMVWYFDVEAAPGPLRQVGGGSMGQTNGRGRIDEFQLFDVFNSHHNGPHLVFRPRGDTCRDFV